MSSKTLLLLTALALAGLFGRDGAAQTPDAAKWADIQAKGQAEGELNVTGPPAPALRAGLSAAFKARHGITLNYFGETTGAIIARVDTEAKAGHLTIDAHIGGAPTCWVFASRGQIADINGALVDPAILQPASWKYGKLKFNEMKADATGPNDPKCAFQFTEWVFTFLFDNAETVKPQIESWNDLLKPQFKNKIAAFDPRSSGPGETPVGYLGKVMGNDYLRSLYIGQNVRFSADSRQLAEWVARGEYPIGIGLVPFAVEIYRKQGLPIVPVSPKEGGGPLTGGFGSIMLFANSPHPNAAKVFANWLATKEAGDIYEATMMESSLRTDVATGTVPDYARPQPGAKNQIDDYVYSYYAGQRISAIEGLKKELPK